MVTGSIIICKICGKGKYRPRYKVLEGTKYCSNACRNKGVVKLKTVPCSRCNKPITRKPSLFRGNLAFCDYSCARLFSVEQKGRHLNHNMRTVPKPYKHLFPDFCVICGFNRVIELAHIIPYNRGGTIHPDNIIALCPNHHTLFDKDLLTADELDIVSDYMIQAWGSQFSAPTLPFPEISNGCTDN